MSDHTQVEVPRIPGCDICMAELGTKILPATVDGKTTMGPWANMCEGHFALLGVGLGLGKGQRLVLKPE